MYNEHKLHLYSQVFAKASDHNTVKLGLIAGDNGSRKSVSTHNLLPIETTNSNYLNFGDNLSLYPFGEVIDSYYQEHKLTWRQGERVYNVHAH